MSDDLIAVEGKTSLPWLELANYSANPTDTNDNRRGICAVGSNLKFWDGSAWVVINGGSGSATWSTTGNTDTVTDDNVTADSVIVIMHTNAYEGNWHITPAAGSFTVTSSDVEANTVTYKYLIL